jgi:hypothetical protein
VNPKVSQDEPILLRVLNKANCMPNTQSAKLLSFQCWVKTDRLENRHLSKIDSTTAKQGEKYLGNSRNKSRVPFAKEFAGSFAVQMWIKPLPHWNTRTLFANSTVRCASSQKSRARILVKNPLTGREGEQDLAASGEMNAI